MKRNDNKRNDTAFDPARGVSPGEQAGRAVRRHVLMFRGAILLLLAAYLGGVGCVLYADTQVSSRLRGVFLLAVGTALALRLLLAVWDELTRRRVSRKDLQTRRDYNAYLAHWRKDAASCNAALLAMAKQDLCLGQPEQTLRDLDGVTGGRLTKAQLKTFYFYQAAAARLTGDEGLCADALLRCKGIPPGAAGVSDGYGAGHAVSGGHAGSGAAGGAGGRGIRLGRRKTQTAACDAAPVGRVPGRLHRLVLRRGRAAALPL
ncbi:MAG: hypothetical protein LUD82_05995 [Clostridiales bacterium]|nr:hypothetical protein [Clostridiales bacterium]